MEKRRIFAVILFALILSVNYVLPCFAVNFIEANSIINQAELELNSAFVQVAEAQDAGADAEKLVTKLNIASDFLSQAHLAIRVDDYESASSFATECIETIEGVNIEASKLKIDAQRNQSNIIFLNFIGSAVGLIFLLILGFFCWKGLKKWYFRKILDKTPKMEVIG